MQVIAQFREQTDVTPAAYRFHLARLWPVIELLAAKDPRLAEWYLKGQTEEDARLYPVYEAAETPSTAALAVLTEKYRGDDKLAKTIGIWNGITDRKEGASLSLAFDTGSLPCDFDLNVGEESPSSSRFGNFESTAQIVAAVARSYSPAYVTVAPRKYIRKQVFDDKPGVGWMLYLPKIVTQQQVPEARALLPLMDDGKKQTGTVIVSVTDAPFAIDNPEHVETANRIEIRLVDQDMLPRYADI